MPLFLIENQKQHNEQGHKNQGNGGNIYLIIVLEPSNCGGGSVGHLKMRMIVVWDTWQASANLIYQLVRRL